MLKFPVGADLIDDELNLGMPRMGRKRCRQNQYAKDAPCKGKFARNHLPRQQRQPKDDHAAS
jgi:hypothetical protein